MTHDLTALADLIEYVERNECTHEGTHRGGGIWTICDECGLKWADDRGGFVPYKEPPELARAKAALRAAAVQGEPVAGETSKMAGALSRLDEIHILDRHGRYGRLAKEAADLLRTTPAATKSDTGAEKSEPPKALFIEGWITDEFAAGRKTPICNVALPDHGGADAGVKKEIDFYRGMSDAQVYSGKHVANILETVLALSHQPAHVAANASAEAKNALYWAVGRWNDEVLNRPLQNIHRRSLDTTWRQVIRHFGGDDRELCGPTHDELLDGGAHPHDSDCDKQKECCDLAAKEPCSDCPFPNPDAAMRGLTDLERTLLIASKAAQNYIANTESELGMTLKSGELLRAAIAKAEACEISTHPHASDCDKQGKIRCNTRRCYDLGCFGLCGDETTKSEGGEKAGAPVVSSEVLNTAGATRQFVGERHPSDRTADCDKQGER